MFGGNVSTFNFVQLIKLFLRSNNEPVPPIYSILVKYLNSSKY
nr:MAG TPA: hypothetical protein [Caudoviricetes sp.]